MTVAIERTMMNLLLKALVITGVVSIWVAALLLFGPVLESKWAPVMTNVDFTEAPATGPYVAIAVTARKERTCEFLDATVLAFDDGQWKKGSVEFSTPGTYTSRPVGQQGLGTWKVRPVTESFKIEMRHRCHFAWTTVTELPTWKQF